MLSKWKWGFVCVASWWSVSQGAAGGGQQPASQTGNAGVQGVSFNVQRDAAVLQVPPAPAPYRVRTLCYRLEEDPTTDTPLYLSTIDGAAGLGTAVAGLTLSPSTSPECLDRKAISTDPLQMRQHLVIALLISEDLKKKLSRLSVNLTSQSVSPFVPNPARGNIDVTPPAGPAGGGAKAPQAAFYFLEWPYALNADTIPTVSITAEYHQTTTAKDSTGAIAPAKGTDTVSWVNLPVGQESLSQVHALSYYNIDTGVVYNTVRNRTFGFDATTKNPISTGSTPIIDPVLFFTYYFKPLDAEREWQASDLIPGVALGISLSSPTSNFYLGPTFEIRRGIQLVLGVSESKVPHLAPSNTYNAAPSSSSSSPATVQRFSTGFYVGFSFNFKSFIGSLTGLGGGGGGKSGS